MASLLAVLWLISWRRYHKNCFIDRRYILNLLCLCSVDLFLCLSRSSNELGFDAFAHGFVIDRRSFWNGIFWECTLFLCSSRSCPHGLQQYLVCFYCMSQVGDWCRLCGIGEIWLKMQRTNKKRVTSLIWKLRDRWMEKLSNLHIYRLGHWVFLFYVQTPVFLFLLFFMNTK